MIIEHMRISLSLKKTLFLKNSITSRKINFKDLLLDITAISLHLQGKQISYQTSDPKQTLHTDILSVIPEANDWKNIY